MTRHTLSLDGRWQFWTDPTGALTTESFADRATDSRAPTSVAVPAPWQSQSPELREYMGVGWYRRSFDLPQDLLDGRALILHFGAVDYFAEVWVNGHKAGEHEGGYLPFEFDVTHAARPGANEIVVRVVDTYDDFPEVPHGKQSWYGPLSGLWQSVWVESRPPMHIRALRITPQPQRDWVQVAVSLSRPMAEGDVLRFEVTDPDGKSVARIESRQTSILIPVPSPKRWDVDSPNLYTLRVALNNTRDTADTLSDTFGFRTIETRDGQILLNGHPIYLRGALDQDYYPDLICTPPSLEYIEDQFRKARHMGLNCLRIHIKVGDPRYYQAADRVGLLIWTELPNWQLLSEAAKRRARETLEGMVARDWNHPSIVIRTIINEAWGIDVFNPEHRAWLSETYDELKAMDPHRLVVGNSACGGNFHVVTDIEDFHNYYSIPDHYTKWRDWVANFAGRPAWSFAHAPANSSEIRQFLRDPWVRRPLTPAPGIRRRGDEPLVISEFGNWGLPDVDQLKAANGGQEPWWFETGLERDDPVVYPHGVEQRFKLYHLDRIFPTLSDLSRASQRMQLVALKYGIEQMRLHPSIQGYVVTEFTDVHWESNGLLDMNRQSKVLYDSFAQINADDVIVPQWDRAAFWEGELCEVRLVVSHYSNKDLQNSRLEWQLEGWSAIRGVFSNLSPGSATVTNIGSLTFEVPPIERSTRARLSLRLIAEDGKLAASTWHDVYFFPHSAAQPIAAPIYATEPSLADSLRALGYNVVGSVGEAEMVVTATMDDALREFVLKSGMVLWLADTDDAQQAYLSGTRVVPRKGTPWQGDWASNMNWIDPTVFSDIPTDSLVDFAFADLTPEHVIVGVHPYHFATDVHAGLFVGWIHKPVALIADLRLGRGRMLICTFRLREHLTSHPVAAIMLREMVARLAADR